jgi:hypothetical protein
LSNTNESATVAKVEKNYNLNEALRAESPVVERTGGRAGIEVSNGLAGLSVIGLIRCV